MNNPPIKKTPQCIRSPQGHRKIHARILWIHIFVGPLDNFVQFLRALLCFTRYLYGDPKSAEFAGMPEAAIKTKCVDFILELDEITEALATLVMKGEMP